jgi:hypothetical protein
MGSFTIMSVVAILYRDLCDMGLPQIKVNGLLNTAHINKKENLNYRGLF